MEGVVDVIETPEYVRHNINGASGILNRFGEVVIPERYAYAEVFDGGFSADGIRVTEHIDQQVVRDSGYADETGHFIQVYGGTRDGADDCAPYVNLDTGETALGENDGLPEGYYKGGKQTLVGFNREGNIGIKGPNGNWVVPQSSSTLQMSHHPVSPVSFNDSTCNLRQSRSLSKESDLLLWLRGQDLNL